LKNFWQRPEGIVGKVVLVLGGIAVAYGFVQMLPFLIAAATDTLHLAIVYRGDLGVPFHRHGQARANAREAHVPKHHAISGRDCLSSWTHRHPEELHREMKKISRSWTNNFGNLNGSSSINSPSDIA